MMTKHLRYVFSVLLCCFLGVLTSCGNGEKRPEPDTTKEEGSIMMTDEQIVFSNRYVSLTLNRKGKITSLTDVASGEELLISGRPNAAAYLTGKGNDNRIYPERAEWDENGKITVTFRNGSRAALSVSVYPEIMVIAAEEVPQDCYGMTYFELSLNPENADRFRAFGYAMKTNTDTVYFPSDFGMITARCYPEIGTDGSRFALVCTPVKEFEETLRIVNQYIEPGEMNVSETGGAWAKTAEINRKTYSILTDINAEDVLTIAKDFQSKGIGLVNFHYGTVFVQGDMTFHEKYGGVTGFRNKITNVFRAYGIDVGMHTYTSYLQQSSRYVSDPEWQKDLDILGRYTLERALDSSDKVVILKEGYDSFSTTVGYSIENSRYLLIDSEIIEFRRVSDSGLTLCIRGALGTKPAAHREGAEVRHLVMLFDCLRAAQGSELFYQIARDTAEAYNAGGFSAIYFDAMFGTPGYGYHDMEYNFYYTAEFIREVLAHCEKAPRIEYSVMLPSLWYSRSCMGAWDFATRGYKDYIGFHCEVNEDNDGSYYLPTTLGWYNMFPSASYYKDPLPDYQIHYMFEDDVDYLGKSMIATDSSLAYWINSDGGKYPALTKNHDRIALYDRLRLENCFSEEIRRRLGEGEWKLIEKNGKYGFRQMQYHRSVITSEESNRVSGSNPFEESAPEYIRIEGLYAAKPGGREQLLADFDENLPLGENPPAAVAFQTPLDISEIPALKVRVYGDGSGDYISIQLKSAVETIPGTVDHLICLDFTGWREMTLAEAMTGIYPGTRWSEDWTTYVHEYRELCAHEKLVCLNVRLIGECKNVRLDWIKAVEASDNIIFNPSLILNGSKLTFYCELTAASFIELTDGKAMLYDAYGNSREISLSGTLPEVKGEYTGELNCSSTTTGELRAYVTVGFGGEELFDP